MRRSLLLSTLGHCASSVGTPWAATQACGRDWFRSDSPGHFHGDDRAIVIEWSAVPGVAEYILELENESANPEQSLTLNLPADTTRFRVPAHWLVDGAEYQVGVAAVARNGNVVFTEIQFTTAD